MLRIKKNKLSMRTKAKNNRLSKIGVIIAYIYIYIYIYKIKMKDSFCYEMQICLSIF